MRIAIDIRSVGGKMCGVSRMSLNLVQALAKIDRDNRYSVYVSPEQAQFSLPASNFIIKPVSLRRYSIQEHLHFQDIVNSDSPDIFHSTHQSFPFFFNIAAKRLVTICDLFAPKYPWFFEKHGPVMKHVARTYFDILMRRTLNNADHIAAISSYTKNDIIEKYDIPSDRITVVHLAAGDTGNTKGLERITNPRFTLPQKPFCLFVGNFKAYKNVEGAINAIQKFNERHPENKVCLVVAGNDIDNLPRVKSYAQRHGAAEYTAFMGSVTDSELKTLYREAICLLFPSLHEGFGIPVLEAMTTGLPVVCSRTTSLPEVAGDAALLINPSAPEDIADAINKLVNFPGLREDLIEKGHKNAARFSWEMAATQYLKIYRDLTSAT